MKRILALVIALMLVLSMGIAFADTTYTDTTSVTVKKLYKLVGDEDTAFSPAETFTLKQVGDGVVTDGDATSAPTLGTITGATYARGAATNAGKEGTITIALPTYTQVGVYEYTLKEVVPTTPNAGVTYYTDDILLRVTVIEQKGRIRVGAVHVESPDSPSYEEGSTKTDTFENTYSAGDLSISKTVTGNLGDKSKYFKVTVTLTGETGKAYPDSFAVTGGSYADNPSAAVLGGNGNVFYLKDGETIAISNLPYGVTYTVVEDDYTVTGEEYDPAVYAFSDTNKKIDSAKDTVDITNNKDVDVDTGINMDSLPYIVLLGIVVLAGIAMMLKKRFNND